VALQRVDPSAADDLPDYKAVRAGKAEAPPAPVRRPPAFARAELSARFDETRDHFQALRDQVRVETPDPYINAAMEALNVGAEATWDGPQQAVMHGAVAWRTRLLGWRGPYWLDALGRPERADQHFRAWAKGQNVSPIPATIPPADEDANLARAEKALHSNGDLSNSHYDMNTVYIDALFRHLEWSGDLKLARDLWPTITRPGSAGCSGANTGRRSCRYTRPMPRSGPATTSRTMAAARPIRRPTRPITTAWRPSWRG
jgi:hypothetical protein